MKLWKKTAVAAVTLFATAASATASDKIIALGAGYNTYNNDAVVGLEFTYKFTNFFRLAPSVNYAFRNHGRDALMVNVNAQFPVFSIPVMSFYPVVGVNYSSWNFHDHFSDDTSSRDSNLGLNLGAGFGFNLGGSLRLGLEGDYNLVRHSSGVTVMAKIGYAF